MSIRVSGTPQGAAHGVRSVAGRGRDVNEDATVCGPHWFAVADGMGGRCAGDVASRLAVEALRDRSVPSSVDELRRVLDGIDGSIRTRARHDGTVGMGTTLAGVTPVGDDLAVFHIGDSRCYRLHDGGLTLVTHDHSHVQGLVDAGVIDADQARYHRLRHVITRALGVDGGAGAEITIVPSRAGRLLLCSDGLTGALPARAIGRVLAGLPDPQAAADRLVELAIEGGARDDVTALVVDQDDPLVGACTDRATA